MRHLISGADCAIAGAATAVAAAPTAETFKKSRRFILRHLLGLGTFPIWLARLLPRRSRPQQPKAIPRGNNTDGQSAIRDKGMKGVQKSHMRQSRIRLKRPVRPRRSRLEADRGASRPRC